MGVPVSSARFPGPLAAVSYPSFDDVIDTRYTVIGKLRGIGEQARYSRVELKLEGQHAIALPHH